MAKRNIGLYIALGLLGAAGIGTGYAVMSRKKKPRGKDAAAPQPEKPDTQPGVIACPKCGNKFKEYELYCPFCRNPVD